MSQFGALLVDAGGTLIPDRLPEPPALRGIREQRLAALLPELDRRRIAQLLDGLITYAEVAEHGVRQSTLAAIAECLSSVDSSLAGRAGDVRLALSQTTGRDQPFPGHRELLETASQLGLRRVLVSNTTWVSGSDWWLWRMSKLGLAGCLEGVVTSFDVGWRKPHRVIFDRALELAGCAAEACVFIGDNERKDVEPALAMGMTVIRVGIQEPPTPTRGQHFATSLEEARNALRLVCQNQL